jgi:anti-sigma regulatory factor (Ser/Thr protein kinase)
LRHTHISIAVTDRSSVGEARRASAHEALVLGWGEEERNNVGIVATEAANNILLHAKTGELLICPASEGESSWIDLLALDAGPGIADVSRAMEDGYSTVGTPGQGLGAISRLSHVSSLYSIQGKGTAYWSRFVHGRLKPEAATGVVCIPVKGETVCGDTFWFSLGASRSLYMVVDGLGHGPGAAQAARAALAIVERHSGEGGIEIMMRTHDALKSTRGAAMSIAVVDHDRSTLAYTGIGNVSASLTTGASTRNLVAQNGTLGAAMPRTPQEYTYPIESQTLLMMFSDGLNSKASLTGYPGAQTRHPALLSGLLYRDFSRKRDDATVLIAPLGGPRA